jgi:hypothetical protein
MGNFFPTLSTRHDYTNESAKMARKQSSLHSYDFPSLQRDGGWRPFVLIYFFKDGMVIAYFFMELRGVAIAHL